jgi:type II secretory pathway pseudopilin PulG
MTRFLRYFIRRQNDAGVNLIEMALVLGIIGLIVGGIFIAWGSVTTNNKLRDAGNMVTIIIQQVRSVYSNRSSMESASGDNFTNALVQAELLPRQWQTSSGAIQNPWGGNVLITPESYSGGSVMDGINISFGMPNQIDCWKFVNNMIGMARGEGLYRVDGVNVNVNTNFASVKSSVCTASSLSLHFTLKSMN